VLRTLYGTIHNCLFIKSTSKGFNFLYEDRSQIIFKGKHMYNREWAHMKVPRLKQGAEVSIDTACILEVWEYSEDNDKRINKQLKKYKNRIRAEEYEK
jgi:hypothetical protein